MGEGKRESRYCVVLRTGENFEERQYFFDFKERIQKIFDSCKFNSEKNVVWTWHIEWIYDKNAEIHFKKRKPSSIEIIASAEKTSDAKKAANLCAKY